eukprot:CFRG4014T1
MGCKSNILLLMNLVSMFVHQVSGRWAFNFMNLLIPTADFKCVVVQIGFDTNPTKFVSKPLCFEQRMLIQAESLDKDVENLPVSIKTVNEDTSIGDLVINTTFVNLYSNDSRNVWFIYRNVSVSDRPLLYGMDSGVVGEAECKMSFLNLANTLVDIDLRQNNKYESVGTLGFSENTTVDHLGKFSQNYRYRYIARDGETFTQGLLPVAVRQTVDLGYTINVVFYRNLEQFVVREFRAVLDNDLVVGPVDYVELLSNGEATRINQEVSPTPLKQPNASDEKDAKGDKTVLIVGSDSSDADATDWIVVILTSVVYVVLVVSLLHWMFQLFTTMRTLRRRMRGDLGKIKNARTKMLVNIEAKDKDKDKGKGKDRDLGKKRDGRRVKMDSSGRVKDALSSMSNGLLFGEQCTLTENIEEVQKAQRQNTDVNYDEYEEDTVYNSEKMYPNIVKGFNTMGVTYSPCAFSATGSFHHEIVIDSLGSNVPPPAQRSHQHTLLNPVQTHKRAGTSSAQVKYL